MLFDAGNLTVARHGPTGAFSKLFIRYSFIGAKLKNKSELSLGGIALKMLLEKEQLVIDRVIPISLIMGARPGREIMVDTTLEKGRMEILIDSQEKIIFPAVYRDRDATPFQKGHEINRGMGFPILSMRSLLTQFVTHIPIFWKRTNIQSSADAANCRKNITMANTIPHRTMSTHAITRDSASLPTGESRIEAINRRRKLTRDKSLITREGA